MKSKHSRSYTSWMRVVGIGACVAASLAVAACGSSATATGASATGAPTSAVSVSPSPAAAPSATATTASQNPAPPTATPSVSPTPTKKATASGYASAKSQWQKGATTISANQGSYWAKAAADLKSGESSDPGDTSGYPNAIKDLKSLISLPDAQQTPTQNAQYQSDIKTLNVFFQTPGLYQ